MMKPTMKLRYVKREVPAWNGIIDEPPCAKIVEVLQQWFESSYDEEDGYWIDIPIEIEE